MVATMKEAESTIRVPLMPQSLDSIYLSVMNRDDVTLVERTAKRPNKVRRALPRPGSSDARNLPDANCF